MLVAGIILFGFWLRVFRVNIFQIGKAFLNEYLLRGPSRTHCRAPNGGSSCINGFSIQESSRSNFRPPTIAVLLLCRDRSSWPAYRPVRFYNYTDCPLVPSKLCVFLPLLVNSLATQPYYQLSIKAKHCICKHWETVCSSQCHLDMISLVEYLARI